MKRILSMICLLAVLAGNLLITTGCNEQKKIFYISSYHDGYPSSDDIREGIIESLQGEAVSLKISYMDTKRNPDPEHVDARVQDILEEIDRFDPDLIIASDDNAVGKLVVPYLQDRTLPIVFCGVNWSAEKYGLNENVTGMLEVMPLKECIQTIKSLNPDVRRISVLSENSQSEKNNTELLDTLYSNLGMQVEYRLVDEFEQWLSAFKELSLSSDLIYMPTNGAIRNWNKEEAMDFVQQNLNVPTITCDDFMMDYCVFGLTKDAREQGQWAAQTALEILDGKLPSDIPFSRNKRFTTYLNQTLADAMGFSLLEEPAENFVVLK